MPLGMGGTRRLDAGGTPTVDSSRRGSERGQVVQPDRQGEFTKNARPSLRADKGEKQGKGRWSGPPDSRDVWGAAGGADRISREGAEGRKLSTGGDKASIDTEARKQGKAGDRYSNGAGQSR